MNTEKPRVLHVIARFNVGGTARYLENLLPGLVENFETLLAVGHVQGYEIEDHRLDSIEFVRIENLGRRINLTRDIRAYFELRRIIKRFEPHIIHSHTFKAGVLSRLMFFRILKVHTFHGHLLGDPEFSGLVRRIIINSERILAKLTNILISVGDQVSKDLLEVGIGKPNQYISIASESRKLNFLARETSREILAIHPGERVVLWMARMAPVKNPSLALEVARQLPDITFLMAGGGELFNKILELAPSNVRFLGWVEAANVIPAADIFLSTSFSEGVPYSLIEVISAGVPIVAVESGAISEIVHDGTNGILTSQDPSEISAQISGLFSDSSPDLAIRNKQPQSNAPNFEVSSMKLKHLSVYKDILL